MGSVSSAAAFLNTFWSHLAEEPWVAEHPAMEPGRNGRSCAVPLFLHADETEYVKDQKVYVVSISGMAHGDPVTTKLLVGVLPSDLMQHEGTTNVTLQAVLAFVRWSFEVLLEGAWPSTGFGGAALQGYRAERAGQRLAGSFFGAFAGVKGDQVWLVDAFGFDRYFRCNYICWHCRASKLAGPLLWTNVAADAPWRATNEPAAWHGSLLGLPGLHRGNVHSDLMHLLWVKGSGNDLVGTTLVLLAKHAVFPLSSEGSEGSFATQLRAGYQAFKAWARAEGLGTAAEPWTPKSVHYTTVRTFPYLGGKAADARLIIMWLHHFVGQVPALAEPWWADLVLCLHNLASFVHGVSSMGVLLQPPEALKLRRAGEAFVVVYLRLASQAVAADTAMFKIRPKLHYFHHLAMNIKVLNPKVLSCFGEESYMGVVGKLAGKVHRRAVAVRTLQRYLIRLAEVLAKRGAPRPAAKRGAHAAP